MKLIRGFEGPPVWRGGYVAIGNFDGVHRGHQAMIARLRSLADNASVPAVCLTFDPHPITLLRPESVPPRLSTLERKAELLGRYGVDILIAYPTDPQLLRLTPEEFFAGILSRELNARGVVEGPNFRFGRDRAGDVTLLSELCEGNGITLDVVEPVVFAGRLVSSSVVRELIARGDIERAVDLLGHAYRASGTVVEGSRRGATIGFPTANLEGVATLLPANGVYAATATVDGERYSAAVNLGPNPTFGENRQKVEAHLIDSSVDLYGKTLHLDFVARIRDVVHFENTDRLRTQLEEDVALTRKLLVKASSGS